MHLPEDAERERQLADLCAAGGIVAAIREF
jgi:hypothetical protein